VVDGCAWACRRVVGCADPVLMGRGFVWALWVCDVSCCPPLSPVLEYREYN
jgi:hypothetical protein